MRIWDRVVFDSEFVRDGLEETDLCKTNAFSQRLNKMLSKDTKYSVGFHQIGWNGILNDEISLSKSFFDNGIRTIRSGEQGGVVQCVAILGNSDIQKKIELSTERFYYMSNVEEKEGACIVAIPEFLKGKDGKKYSLGVFPDNLEHSERNNLNPEDYPISVLFNKIGYLPREFIIGIIYNSQSGETLLDSNPNFISILPEDMQSELLEGFFDMGLPKEEYKSYEDEKKDTQKLGQETIEKQNDIQEKNRVERDMMAQQKLLESEKDIEER